jgi:two-component system, NtrC family, nitrogen regulation response regulator NtrX
MTEGEKKKVLLIDDESSVLFALKLLLQALGYEVADFAIALQGLEYLRQGNTADILICDLRMNPVNGFQVLEEAKKIRPELPFILMSGHALEEEIEKAKSMGSSGFLAKPFRPEEFKSLMNEIG